MAEEKELAGEVTSNQAIVRRYSETVAKSPKDIKRGEGVFLDARGVAVGRSRFRRLVSFWQLGMFGAVIGGGVLVISGSLFPGALLYLIGAMPMLVGRYRGYGKLMAIDVVIRQGHLEEGQRRFDELADLRQRNPFGYCYLAGSLASHRGDHTTALRWWREAFPRSKGLRRELLKLSITKALLLSGHTEEARRELASVTFPPEADVVLTGQSLTKVMFALCDSSATLPSEEELHELARRALEYSHTGVELAAIGRAFERTGEHDMARFLAAEAVERMHYPYLATWWPSLQQWLENVGRG